MSPFSISYVKGDATRPLGDGHKIIAHICNDVGAWGSGFVISLSKRWSKPEREFRRNYELNGPPELGFVQLVPVASNITVANMVAQHGVGISRHGKPPIRYDALRECLQQVGDAAAAEAASIHMPRIGCSLSGGQWRLVEPIIQEELCDRGIQVTVYDFHGGHFNQ